MRIPLLLLTIFWGMLLPANATYMYVIFNNNTYLEYIRETDSIDIRNKNDCYYFAAEYIIDLDREDISEIDYIECKTNNKKVRQIGTSRLKRLWDDFYSTNN